MQCNAIQLLCEIRFSSKSTRFSPCKSPPPVPICPAKSREASSPAGHCHHGGRRILGVPFGLRHSSAIHYLLSLGANAMRSTTRVNKTWGQVRGPLFRPFTPLHHAARDLSSITIIEPPPSTCFFFLFFSSPSFHVLLVKAFI